MEYGPFERQPPYSRKERAISINKPKDDYCLLGIHNLQL